jgi:hypothetical protein
MDSGSGLLVMIMMTTCFLLRAPVRVCEGFVYAGFKTKTVQYVVQLHTLGSLPLCCYYYYYYCMSCIREDPIPLHGDPGMEFHSCAFLRLARDCSSTDIACTRAREFMPMLMRTLPAYSSLRSLDEPID